VSNSTESETLNDGPREQNSVFCSEFNLHPSALFPGLPLVVSWFAFALIRICIGASENRRSLASNGHGEDSSECRESPEWFIHVARFNHSVSVPPLVRHTVCRAGGFAATIRPVVARMSRLWQGWGLCCNHMASSSQDEQVMAGLGALLRPYSQ